MIQTFYLKQIQHERHDPFRRHIWNLNKPDKHSMRATVNTVLEYNLSRRADMGAIYFDPTG